jgi:hypothetical protein
MLKEVNLDIFLKMENLIAHRTACNLVEPAVDAFVVKNMEAAQHPTLILIFDGTKADDAITYKILFVFHPYQNGLDLCISLLGKHFLNSKICPRNTLCP